MIYLWFILMIVCAILFGVAVMGADEAWKPASSFCGFLLFLGLFCVCFDNRIQVSKIDALKDMGKEPIKKEQIYEMNQKQLDQLYKITTLKDTYYFEAEEKE